MKTMLLGAALFLITACGSCNDEPSELDTKEVYSILQSYGYEWSGKSSSGGYILVVSALGSRYDILGLPIKGRERGFVWLVLNPKCPNNPNWYVVVPLGATGALSPTEFDELNGKVKLPKQAKSAIFRLTGRNQSSD